MGWLADLGSGISSFFKGTAAVVSGTSQAIWYWVTGATEDVANGVEDAVQAVNDAVTDALDKAKAWVIEQIQKLTEEWRLFKYRFSQAVSKWMDDPVRFWLTIAGVVALVVVFPELMSALKSTDAWKVASTTFKLIKEAVGGFLVKIGYVQALEVHKIFLLLNPKYTSFWSDLDQAFMGLAEQIEIGVGTMNAITESVRMLYFNTYTMLGMDVDTIEMKFYDDATKFWSNANSVWELYVRNPSAIFDAIQRELVYPVLTEQANLGGERAKHLLEMSDKVDTAILNADAVRLSLENVIESLPDDMEALINDKTSGFFDEIDSLFEDKLLPFSEKLEGATAIIKQDMKEIQLAIIENMARQPSELEKFVKSLFDGSLDISGIKTDMANLLGRIVSDTNTKAVELDVISDIINQKDERPVPLPIQTSNETPYKPLIDLSKIVINLPSDGWFVGEY